MNIEFWNIGKDQYPFITKGVSEYEQRIKRYIPFEMHRFKPQKNWKNMNEKELIKAESSFYADRADRRDEIVLLDESGTSMKSVAFARWLNKQMVSVPGSLLFICGGSYGLDRSVFPSVRKTLSLSRMTMSHQIVRIVFIEQLYRALTILKNEPYHH